MDLENPNLDQYNYMLPEERIAKHPLPGRDQSKLLIYRNKKTTNDIFKHIHSYIDPGSLLVFNNTKVIHARIRFQKDTGANIEIFCLEPHKPNDYQMALNAKRSCTWRCMIGNAKKWKTGALRKTINHGNKSINLIAENEEKTGNSFIVKFSWDQDVLFHQILNHSGMIPIPPYLKRESNENDKSRYQTIYSNIQGSVAAPTAGLHFTSEALKRIKDKGIDTENITLHVGAGTFTPVKTRIITDHPMHTERFYIYRKNLDKLLQHRGNIISVGTTTLRCLESIYWTGVKILQHNGISNTSFALGQWEYTKLHQDIPLKEALESIKNYMIVHNIEIMEATTQIMIIPGYKFRIPHALITNFHQPKSTLLMLIAAFVGENWKNIYSYALKHNFRFLSYGDSNLLFHE